MLEAGQHRASYFITLTYAPEHLPKDGKVHVEAMQLFMKRLRFYNEGVSIRYYYVGEYGERSGRPHYHAIIFGDIAADSVRKAWPFGFVHIGLLTLASAGYTLGYITKGLVKEKGEFARMSLNPAIGKGVAKEIAAGLRPDVLEKLNGDAPVVFRANGKVHLIGRYLRNVIRKELGLAPREPEHIARRRQLEAMLAEAAGPKESHAEKAVAVTNLHRSKRYL